MIDKTKPTDIYSIVFNAQSVSNVLFVHQSQLNMDSTDDTLADVNVTAKFRLM